MFTRRAVYSTRRPLTLSIQSSHTDYTDLHCSKSLPMFSVGKCLQKGLDWIVSFMLARVSGCWRLRTCNISVTESYMKNNESQNLGGPETPQPP